MNQTMTITDEEINKLNKTMSACFYLDKHDPGGIAFFTDDQILGYPKSLGELIHLAYVYGFNECKEETLKSYAKIKAELDELMKEHSEIKFEYKKSTNEFNEKVFSPQGGYVYFLQAGDYVKIGYSATIHQRIKQLQTGCPFELKLILALKGSLAIEKAFHKRFHEERYNNEWFNYSFRIREFIESQKSENLQLI